MAWIDDRIWAHPKFQRVDIPARWVAVSAICYSSGFGLGGRLDRGQQRVIGATARIRRQLVAAELWHENPDGSIEIHDWDEHNGLREERRLKQQASDRRRKALMRDVELRTIVRERDGDQCRYCGRAVDFHDRKGQLGGTYDHVDPDGENTADNVVVCCRSCSARKDGRSLNEARMTLLAPPLRIQPDLTHRTRSEVDNGSSPDLAGIGPDLDLSSRAPARVAAGARPMTVDGVTGDLPSTSDTSSSGVPTPADDDELHELEPSASQLAEWRLRRDEDPDRFSACLKRARDKGHGTGAALLTDLLRRGVHPEADPDATAELEQKLAARRERHTELLHAADQLCRNWNGPPRTDAIGDTLDQLERDHRATLTTAERDRLTDLAIEATDREPVLAPASDSSDSESARA